MRNWKNWLFPILTALTVAALALLPLRLSTLEDGELTGTVHAEPLTADNNFPARPPDLPGRVRLLAQYRSVPEFLTIAAQEPEEKKLAELSAQARADLKRLVELGVLPEKSDTYDGAFYGSVFYLRDQRDLSSAAFAELSGYDDETREHLLLCLDGESGHILALDMTSELLWDFPVPAEDAGKAFLEGLGLDYTLDETLMGKGETATFRLTDSGARCVCRKYRDYLEIFLEVDWETADDSLRAAMGYPPAAAVDAGPMQKW